MEEIYKEGKTAQDKVTKKSVSYNSKTRGRNQEESKVVEPEEKYTNLKSLFWVDYREKRDKGMEWIAVFVRTESKVYFSVLRLKSNHTSELQITVL